MDDKRDSGEILLKVLAGTQLLAEEAGANRNDDQADDQPNGADAPSERPQTGEDPDADAGADKRGDHRSMGLVVQLAETTRKDAVASDRVQDAGHRSDAFLTGGQRERKHHHDAGIQLQRFAAYDAQNIEEAAVRIDFGVIGLHRSGKECEHHENHADDQNRGDDTEIVVMAAMITIVQAQAGTPGTSEVRKLVPTRVVTAGSSR